MRRSTAREAAASKVICFGALIPWVLVSCSGPRITAPKEPAAKKVSDEVKANRTNQDEDIREATTRHILEFFEGEDNPEGIPVNQATEEEDIREATFRYIIANNASCQQQAAKNYYLTLSNEDLSDPSDDFMNRFANNKPPVKRVSEGSPSMYIGVLDNKTGEKGLIFRVGKIRWRSKTEVEVYGGYYESGLSASDNFYYLKKSFGKWKVVKDLLLGIS